MSDRTEDLKLGGAARNFFGRYFESAVILRLLEENPHTVTKISVRGEQVSSGNDFSTYRGMHDPAVALVARSATEAEAWKGILSHQKVIPPWSLDGLPSWLFLREWHVSGGNVRRGTRLQINEPPPGPRRGDFRFCSWQDPDSRPSSDGFGLRWDDSYDEAKQTLLDTASRLYQVLAWPWPLRAIESRGTKQRRDDLFGFLHQARIPRGQPDLVLASSSGVDIYEVKHGEARIQKNEAERLKGLQSLDGVRVFLVEGKFPDEMTSVKVSLRQISISERAGAE